MSKQNCDPAASKKSCRVCIAPPQPRKINNYFFNFPLGQYFARKFFRIANCCTNLSAIVLENNC